MLMQISINVLRYFIRNVKMTFLGIIFDTAIVTNFHKYCSRHINFGTHLDSIARNAPFLHSDALSFFLSWDFC